MKAVLFKKGRNPNELLVFGEAEKPVPTRDDDVVIQVHASSINAADYRMMKMGIAPKSKIFGADIAGVVESVGSRVVRFKPGDEIIGDLSNAGFGGFSEYAVAPEGVLAPKPSRLSFAEAAALPLAGGTALQALRMGMVSPGKRVLIVGSSGGVGSYALQLSKHFGAVVTGVCSPGNTEQVRGLGADRVIDYTRDGFDDEYGVYDVIIAINGSYSLVTYKRCLAPGGVCVCAGGSLGQIFRSLLFGRFLSLGSKKFRVLSAKGTAEDLLTLSRIADEGGIRPVIEAEYPLAETPQAVGHVISGHARGKVVIRVP